MVQCKEGKSTAKLQGWDYAIQEPQLRRGPLPFSIHVFRLMWRNKEKVFRGRWFHLVPEARASQQRVTQQLFVNCATGIDAFYGSERQKKSPGSSAFAPVPQLKTPRTRGSARDEAALSAAFTWLREKPWAPPVVPHPKRNRGPAGQLCRGRHRNKTRNRAVKRWWRGSDPGLLGHQWGFYYSSFVTTSKGF